MNLNKSSKSGLVKEAAFYSGSLLLTRLLLSVRGILIPRFLGPTQYGIYNSLLILPEYLLHLHLGTLDALKREIPFCYEQKKSAQARLIRNITFFQYLLSTFFSIILVLIIVQAFSRHLEPMVYYSLGLVCLWIFFLSFETFFSQVVRTDNRFDILSESEIFASLTGFIVMVGMLLIWGLYGLLCSLVLTSILKAGYIYRKTGYRIEWQWDFPELKRLLKIGFPMLLGTILATIFNSVDRFIILAYLKSQELGYYALALTVLSFLTVFMNGIYGVIEPKVYRLYGAKKDVQDVRPLILKVLSEMAIFFPLVLGLTYILFPVVVFYLLPKYLPSLVCVRIMIVGSFFLIFQLGTFNFILTVNRQILIVKMELICIVLHLFISYLLIQRGWGIEGVAISIMGCHALSGLSYLIFSLSLLFTEPKEKYLYLVHFLYPFLALIPLLFLMDYLWGIRGEWKEDLVMVILKIGGLFFLLAPFLWWLRKKLKIFQIGRPGPDFSADTNG